MPKRSHANYHFWLLMFMVFILMSLGLQASWTYVQSGLYTLLQACQNGLQRLVEDLFLSWQLVIPLVIVVVLIRGGGSIYRQWQATRQLTKLFYPLREPLPPHLHPLLHIHGISAENVVFLKLNTIHAFCLGFWQPRIWLTAGLVNLLSKEELSAVLAHEAHHCRQRDPLQLLISRALKSAFFFLPLVGELAKTTELQQEIAADQSAITHLGSDLPLLCALQKLLQQGALSQQKDLSAANLKSATYSAFNATEARLRRLVYPSANMNNRRRLLSNCLISLGIIIILGSTIFLSPAQPARSAQLFSEQDEIGACHIGPDNPNKSPITLVSYNS